VGVAGWVCLPASLPATALFATLLLLMPCNAVLASHGCRPQTAEEAGEGHREQPSSSGGSSGSGGGSGRRKRRLPEGGGSPMDVCPTPFTGKPRPLPHCLLMCLLGSGCQWHMSWMPATKVNKQICCCACCCNCHCCR
jgi:hypothetical protein